MKIFYKARLVAQEEGLIVWIDKWYSVKETPCYHFCTDEQWRIHTKARLPKNKFLKRIHKTSSRFAFESIDIAVDRLRYMKRRQLGHMKREKEFIEAFLKCGSLSFGEHEAEIPNTKDLVLEWLRFD